MESRQESRDFMARWRNQAVRWNILAFKVVVLGGVKRDVVWSRQKASI